MKKPLKTLTLCDESFNPSLVTLAGHHDIKVFNKAFQQEWDADNNSYKKENIEYVYMVKKNKIVDGEKSFIMKTCSPSIKGAKKYTIAQWD